MSWRSLKHRHYADRLFIAAFIFAIAFTWAPVPRLVTTIAGSVSTGVVVMAFALTIAHNRGDLCEDCIADMPLDTEGAVERNQLVLRVWHWITDHRLYFFGGLLALVIVGAILGKHSLGQKILDTLLDGLLIVDIGTGHTHRKLYPWCPWCRPGGDGDDEYADEPTPQEPVAA